MGSMTQFCPDGPWGVAEGEDRPTANKQLLVLWKATRIPSKPTKLKRSHTIRYVQQCSSCCCRDAIAMPRPHNDLLKLLCTHRMSLASPPGGMFLNTLAKKLPDLYGTALGQDRSSPGKRQLANCPTPYGVPSVARAAGTWDSSQNVSAVHRATTSTTADGWQCSVHI